jgi:hypothetical protein
MIYRAVILSILFLRSNIHSQCSDLGGVHLGQAWKELVDRRDPRESQLAITAIVKLCERVSVAAEPWREDL